MKPRFNCPTCNSVNFTYTGETERCCKLCETKWDDYGNVVHPQPISRSEAYEDIINEESQSNTIMDNQQTQPQAIPSLILSPVQQLNVKIADLNETAMKLEDVIASQERRLMELEDELSRIIESKQQQQNTLSRESARKLLARLHEMLVDYAEEEYNQKWVDIEFGNYSDSVRLNQVQDFPCLRQPDLNDLTDAFYDAGIKVLDENNED